MKSVCARIAIRICTLTLSLVAGLQPELARSSGAVPSPSPIPGSTFVDCTKDCPEMIVIRPGTFQMGSKENGDPTSGYPSPVHSVRIPRAFALGKFAVTRAQFQAFAEATGFRSSATDDYEKCKGYDIRRHWELIKINWQNPGYAQGETDPVVCINQHDIESYLNWLSQKTGKSYRLPSEAEWEYAARAGTQTRYFWGDGTADACLHANFRDQAYENEAKDGENFECDDGYIYTAPVGSFRPNAFGLYDMLGNVGQLTADCWHVDYRGAPRDGSTWANGRCLDYVARGGSFYYRPKFVEVAYRESVPSFLRKNWIGFRVARDLE